MEVATSTSYYVINLGCNLQGKTGVWIKLPIEHANLVEATVKVNTGFQIYYYYFITTNWLILKGGFYLFNFYLLLFFNIYLKKNSTYKFVSF